jgi:hypothetical protein
MSEAKPNKVRSLNSFPPRNAFYLITIAFEALHSPPHERERGRAGTVLRGSCIPDVS